MTLAIAIWIVYGALLVARYLRTTAPRRLATLCIVAFSAAITLLWSIEFTSHGGAR